MLLLFCYICRISFFTVVVFCCVQDLTLAWHRNYNNKWNTLKIYIMFETPGFKYLRNACWCYSITSGHAGSGVETESNTKVTGTVWKQSITVKTSNVTAASLTWKEPTIDPATDRKINVFSKPYTKTYRQWTMHHYSTTVLIVYHFTVYMFNYDLLCVPIKC